MPTRGGTKTNPSHKIPRVDDIFVYFGLAPLIYLTIAWVFVRLRGVSDIVRRRLKRAGGGWWDLFDDKSLITHYR